MILESQVSQRLVHRLPLILLAFVFLGLAQARFEWRDVFQTVTIQPDGSVVIADERTLWTDEDFGEAFICVGHPGNVTLTLLPDSGAVDPGPAATAFTQPCERGVRGTEMVVRNAERIQKRRVRFHYRLDGTVDAYSDVVQWYWNLIQLDHPVIVGYRLIVEIPGPMAAPYDVYVHRYGNPEEPSVFLSETRDTLMVAFERIPDGDGVEIRYLMDPALFSLRGGQPGLSRLLEDEARFAASGLDDRSCSAAGGQQATPQDDASVSGLVQGLLSQGATGAAESLLRQRLDGDGSDAEARFALGAVQAVIAIEQLTQDAYRFGLGSGSVGEFGTMFGMEVPSNPAPEPVGYQDLRGALERFVVRLERAESTLAPLADLVGTDAGASLRVRLDLGLVRLDFDGDGVPGEQLSSVLFELRNVTTFDPQGTPCQPIRIDFDLGDAFWLRGYLHMIAGAVEALLAYDAQTLWDATAQLFYARPDTPYPYLEQSAAPDFEGFDLAPIADVVAFIHLLDLPVVEPDRLRSALEHFEATVTMSRASWDAILAEIDDEREWLPNPRQTGVIPSRPGGPPMAVTDAMIESWFELLDEVEAILDGRKLLPYWRVTDGRGLNLRRVFLEPRTFDLVLWLQGVAAAPYLEKGELTRGETWQRILRAFGGRFTPFAFWFN